jgi:xanthine dehydrogenase accessory factor
MSDWLRELRTLQRAGKDCVRVTVMDVRGSAPREIGATMLVTADDLRGTIGGGQLEYECTRLATHHLPGRTSVIPCSESSFSDMTQGNPEKSSNSMTYRGPTRVRFPLGAAMGQCCGGVVDMLFEYLPAEGDDWMGEALRCFGARTPAVLVTSIRAGGEVSRSLLAASGCRGDRPDDAVLAAAGRVLERGGPASCLRDGGTRTLLEPIADSAFQVALFGAGHVGSALVNVLASLDCRVRWIDGRRDVFPNTVPGNVTCVESADPAREALAMPPAAFFIVMTHSHALDYEICEQVLARDDLGWCGLIGSRSKRRRFEKRLRAQGMSDERIGRLTCPIGIAGLDGKKPGEIAVAVAAQLLQVRESRSARARVAPADNVHVLHR